MSGSLDERRAAHDDRADRGAEPFAEAHGDAVEAGAVGREGARARGDGFPEARAVQVHVDGRGLRARPVGDGGAVGQG